MAEIQPSEEYSNFCHLLNFIYLLYFLFTLFFALVHFTSINMSTVCGQGERPPPGPAAARTPPAEPRISPPNTRTDSWWGWRSPRSRAPQAGRTRSHTPGAPRTVQQPDQPTNQPHAPPHKLVKSEWALPPAPSLVAAGPAQLSRSGTTSPSSSPSSRARSAATPVRCFTLTLLLLTFINPIMCEWMYNVKKHPHWQLIPLFQFYSECDWPAFLGLVAFAKADLTPLDWCLWVVEADLVLKSCCL